LRNETQPWLDAIVAANAELDALMPKLREPGTLGKIAALGYRRADVVEALEAMAIDPSIPEGDADPSAQPTRIGALLVRVALGVGPLQRERVLQIAGRLSDPTLRDLVRMTLAPSAAAIDRLLTVRVPIALGAAWVNGLMRALSTHGTTAQWWRARVRLQEVRAERARVEAPRLEPGIERRMGAHFPLAALRRAWLPPGEVPKRRVRTPVSNAHAVIGAFDAMYFPTTTGVPPAAHPLDLETLEHVYDACFDAAPTLRADELGAILRWSPPSQCWAIDALGDAPIVADVVIDFLEDLVRGCTIARDRMTIVRHRSAAVVLGHLYVLDAVAAALQRRAPKRWRAIVEDFAGSLDVDRRAQAGVALCAAQEPEPDILATLLLDPFARVRSTAAHAQVVSLERRAQRSSLRMVVWAALRDREDGYAEAKALFEAGAGQAWPASARRRAWRIAHEYELSETARRWLKILDVGPRWALSHGMSSPAEGSSPSPLAVAVGEPLGARLTSTDGRAIRFDLARDPTQTDRHFAIHEAIVATFVRCAPSSFMRLTLPDGSARAVSAVIDARGRVVLHDEDPRILERIPG
jgi:hypothetical protein